MPPVFSTDEAWTEVIDTLTAAAIRFEMLSTAHRSQVGQQFVQSRGRQAVGIPEQLCAEQPGLQLLPALRSPWTWRTAASPQREPRAVPS